MNKGVVLAWHPHHDPAGNAPLGDERCRGGAIALYLASSPQAPAWSRQAAVALAWSSLHMLMAGIVIGLVLGGVAWGLGRRDYTEPLAVFRSKVLWGIAELGCSLLWGWATGRGYAIVPHNPR